MFNLLFRSWWRISKSDYILWLIIVCFLSIIPIWILWFIFSEDILTVISIYFALEIFIIYIFINLTIKRLHDLDKSWKDFFSSFPNFDLVFKEWKTEDNQYGKYITTTKKLPIAILVTLIVLFIILFTITFFSSIIRIMKNNWAYITSIEEIQKNEVITLEFWNIEPWFFPNWSITDSWDKWNANLQITLNWEKKNGTAYVVLEKIDWERKILNLIISDDLWNEKEIIK